jgi:hypothetical protein
MKKKHKRRYGLAAQIADAKRAMRQWPKWMREAAKQDLATVTVKGAP